IFARQLYRCFQQVVLDGLERAMRQGKSRFVGIARAVLGQVVGKVDYAHAQGAALLGGIERRLYGVILVVEQSVQRAHHQISDAFQLVQRFQRTQVNGRQRAQGNFATGVVEVVQRLGGQRDFHTQVRHAHGRLLGVERAVRVAMVYVLNVDAAGAATLLHHQRKQFDGRQRALANGRVLFVLLIQTFEFVLVRKEGIVQAGYIVRGKQRNVLALEQALVHQLVDLHPIVKMAHEVFFSTAVVF